jgi:hypothetical protein
MDTAEARGIHRRTTFEVTSSLRLRFEARVNRRGPQECWPWLGSMRNGYGAIKHEHGVLGTHVVAFVIANGAVPDGLIVTHSCDNRACCNPSHLKAGTFADNVVEMNERRRITAPRGEETHNAKLTDELVRLIWAFRASGMSRYKIASALGINEWTVKGVLGRKTWRHVTPPTSQESADMVARFQER